MAKGTGRRRIRTGRAWIEQVFSAAQVRQGNIVRRSMHSVSRCASPELLEQIVKERGFHMALIGNQYVILCDPDGQMKIVC
jgi:hypothetical protein